MKIKCLQAKGSGVESLRMRRIFMETLSLTRLALFVERIEVGLFRRSVRIFTAIQDRFLHMHLAPGSEKEKWECMFGTQFLLRLK